jgi:probable rRNA maturation factor
MKNKSKTKMKTAAPSAFRLEFTRRGGPSAFANLVVAVANQQSQQAVDKNRLRKAVQTVLAGEGIGRADISVAIVDDATIHDVNRSYLSHDEPTDVISFALDRKDDFVDGEIVVSADTATAAAKRFGWSPDDELLLYVIHGTLHLVGYDDTSLAVRKTMRQRERHYLRQFGLEPSYRRSLKDLDS